MGRANAKTEATTGTALGGPVDSGLVVRDGVNYYTDSYFNGLADRVRVATRVELAKSVYEEWQEVWSGEGLGDDELMVKVVEFVRGGEK